MVNLVQINVQTEVLVMLGAIKILLEMGLGSTETTVVPILVLPGMVRGVWIVVNGKMVNPFSPVPQQ